MVGNVYTTFVCSCLETCVGTSPWLCKHINHLPFGNFSLWKCVCVLPREGKQGTSVWWGCYCSSPVPEGLGSVGNERLPNSCAVSYFWKPEYLAFLLVAPSPSVNLPTMVSCPWLKVLNWSLPLQKRWEGKKWPHPETLVVGFTDEERKEYAVSPPSLA